MDAEKKAEADALLKEAVEQKGPPDVSEDGLWVNLVENLGDETWINGRFTDVPPKFLAVEDVKTSGF